ncbi:helicase (Snf2/Rad54 family) [Chitinispirillum alkaliphilum]|nr:helicase (Snf2/Rad54 family) [Chitinispirillum alkaliphilum]
MTPFHSQYFAYDITRTGPPGLERLSQSLFNASVDLNPHQVEAALFALRSSLNPGVLLCDEVGLGKTIEAGLVLCQLWAERKRKLLVICPAALRKQWQVELEEKFHLPAQVIDQIVYNKLQKEGKTNPFDNKAINIVSYHYAARKANEIRAIAWDTVVIDEAHKLRNSHREKNVLGQSLRFALENRRKVLLTATPLQNSLTELYGLASFIDEQLFGDYPTFRTLYCGSDGDVSDLKARLGTFVKRTLRRDVLEFIQYTERNLITIRFRPADGEQKLYEAVSEFLQRNGTYSIPPRQRHLLTVVMRKVLASSSSALAGTLDVILERLKGLRVDAKQRVDLTERILADEQIDEELLEQLLEESENSAAVGYDDEEAGIDQEKLETEINEVEQFASWARNIGVDTKTKSLTKALSVGWKRMKQLGAQQKAVIFTESRRTQKYLSEFLENNGYAGQVVCFSGGGADPQIKEIYHKWVLDNPGKATGSKAADIRHAIIDEFRLRSKILIATEAASEGFNLQFCSLLINFDLPWNPQRIEQRIGRIHRYGQKHDVVVINFLNARNSADARVYDLLQHKFKLFEGIFGASDGILGQTESGAGLENKILGIYQNCRSEEQITAAFDKLRQELDEEIQDKLRSTREKIFGHFDEDVQKRLKVQHTEALRTLDRISGNLWRLTKHILGKRAVFDDGSLFFHLKDSPKSNIPAGTYSLARKRDREDTENEVKHRVYHLAHPLGEWCISAAKKSKLPVNNVFFELSDYQTRLSALEPLKGFSGWLTLKLLRIESFDAEEHLLFTAVTDKGQNLDPEIVEQMFRLNGTVGEICFIPPDIEKRLSGDSTVFTDATLRKSAEQNGSLFQERREQLYRWADDVVAAAERELAMAKAALRIAEKEAGSATTVEEQHASQKRIAELESKKRKARRRIDDVEDEIFKKRNELIVQLERRISQKTTVKNIFTLRWTIR